MISLKRYLCFSALVYHKAQTHTLPLELDNFPHDWSPRTASTFGPCLHSRLFPQTAQYRNQALRVLAKSIVSTSWSMMNGWGRSAHQPEYDPPVSSYPVARWGEGPRTVGSHLRPVHLLSSFFFRVESSWDGNELRAIDPEIYKNFPAIWSCRFL